MSKVLVLYYSSYGHIEKMAQAVAEGAREAGAQVDIKRVPELVPEEVAKKSGFKLDQAAPIATVDDLPNYDAIILGVPTRYGRMASQMTNTQVAGELLALAAEYEAEAVEHSHDAQCKQATALTRAVRITNSRAKPCPS